MDGKDLELDDLCNQAMCDFEQDAICNEVMDQLETQSGGGFQFDLIPHIDRRARKFGVHRRVFTTRLVQPEEARLVPQNNLPQLIESALQRAVNQQVLNGDQSDDDILMINMSSNRLRHSYQSHRVRVGEWRNNADSVRHLLEMMSKVLNSNEQFRMDDSFHLEVTHIRDPGTGSGRKRLKLGTKHIDEMLRTKKSIIYINNKDDLCCARALVTIKAKRNQHPQYDSIKRGLPIQEHLAKELHCEARVPEGPCGLGEINLFQIILSEYQIVVVSVDHGYQIIYKGPSKPEEKQLILIKVEDHYHACHSLRGFFGKVYYCVECDKGFDHNDLNKHRCPGKKCFACHQTGCLDFKNATGSAHIRCRLCDRFFFGATCYSSHLHRRSSGTPADYVKKNSVCYTNKRCVNCNKVYSGGEIKRGHVCGYAQCPCCQEYCNLHTHQCYLQPVEEEEKRKERRKRKRGAAAGLVTLRANDPTMNDDDDEEEELTPLFVYFDIEARQDHGEHVANLLCAEREDSDEPIVFEGENCVEAFLDWVRELTNTNDPNLTRPVIVVAHNFQGYDSYFILDEFYKQMICPDQIVNGAKILCMAVGKLKFIDSMCFLQMPLAGFTKAFGLQELKKGFFPHFFNTIENQQYVGEIPASDYYDPEGMSPERREEFQAWLKARQEEGYEFNFRDELVAYCKSDVRLLKEGCMHFQNEFHQLAQFNPMVKCITIASACNRYYRKMCLQPYTIASEPIRGWHGKGKPYSHAALEWLYWQEHCLQQEPCCSTAPTGDRIAHAGNQGERRIGAGRKSVYVDGYDLRTNTVYEFEGCFYHGCPTCFPNRNNRHPKLEDMSMQEIYQRTVERNQCIRESGYNLVVMWECEWNQLKKTCPDIQQFLDTLQLVPRLEPREAFFGGRTNAVKLYCQTQPGEEIRYVDYTSLYPWVNKNSKYPIGHPIIVTQPKGTSISQYFGLVKCTIVPPHNLYHPVLPYRYGGKLTFPLCRTCVETQLSLPLLQRSYHCFHTSDERALTGTWCTPELQEAITQGYRIKNVFEVWHFERQSRDLFKEYVNTFLKIKQEASGWPEDVGNDPAKRNQYIQDYEQHEGIQLDYRNIAKNPGKRSLAKMMLNSFWGKFGQQSNKCNVEGMTSPVKFFDLLRDDSRDIHSIRVVNEEMIEVVHNFQPECDPIQVNTNIFVACFTTCWARLKLLTGVKHLQPEQVLYFDTDSIIYLWRPSLPQLSLGNYLGEFTNELKKGDFITEFASAGPKNYGYRTKQGKVECKVRGFSLNTRGQQQLNFEILKDNVKAELQRPCDKAREIPIWNPNKIVRDKQTKKLNTETEIKRYQLVFDKRVVDSGTFLSYPYGYQNVNLDEEDVNNIQCLADLIDSF